MTTPITRTTRITRTNGTVEIDAQAEPTDDGRIHVSIAVVKLLDQPSSLRPSGSGNHPALEEADRVQIGEPWYEDTLDECTSADLAALADEALAAHS